MGSTGHDCMFIDLFRYASESISLACKYAYRNATPGSTLGGKDLKASSTLSHYTANAANKCYKDSFLLHHKKLGPSKLSVSNDPSIGYPHYNFS